MRSPARRTYTREEIRHNPNLDKEQNYHIKLSTEGYRDRLRRDKDYDLFSLESDKEMQRITHYKKRLLKQRKQENELLLKKVRKLQENNGNNDNRDSDLTDNHSTPPVESSTTPENDDEQSVVNPENENEIKDIELDEQIRQQETAQPPQSEHVRSPTPLLNLPPLIERSISPFQQPISPIQAPRQHSLDSLSSFSPKPDFTFTPPERSITPDPKFIEPQSSNISIVGSQLPSEKEQHSQPFTQSQQLEKHKQQENELLALGIPIIPHNAQQSLANGNEENDNKDANEGDNKNNNDQNDENQDQGNRDDNQENDQPGDDQDGGNGHAANGGDGDDGNGDDDDDNGKRDDDKDKDKKKKGKQERDESDDESDEHDEKDKGDEQPSGLSPRARAPRLIEPGGTHPLSSKERRAIKIRDQQRMEQRRARQRLQDQRDELNLNEDEDEQSPDDDLFRGYYIDPYEDPRYNYVYNFYSSNTVDRYKELTERYAVILNRVENANNNVRGTARFAEEERELMQVSDALSWAGWKLGNSDERRNEMIEETDKILGRNPKKKRRLNIDKDEIIEKCSIKTNESLAEWSRKDYSKNVKFMLPLTTARECYTFKSGYQNCMKDISDLGGALPKGFRKDATGKPISRNNKNFPNVILQSVDYAALRGNEQEDIDIDLNLGVSQRNTQQRQSRMQREKIGEDSMDMSGLQGLESLQVPTPRRLQDRSTDNITDPRARDITVPVSNPRLPMLTAPLNTPSSAPVDSEFTEAIKALLTNQASMNRAITGMMNVAKPTSLEDKIEFEKKKIYHTQAAKIAIGEKLKFDATFSGNNGNVRKLLLSIITFKRKLSEYILRNEISRTDKAEAATMIPRIVAVFTGRAKKLWDDHPDKIFDSINDWLKSWFDLHFPQDGSLKILYDELKDYKTTLEDNLLTITQQYEIIRKQYDLAYDKAGNFERIGLTLDKYGHSQNIIKGLPFELKREFADRYRATHLPYDTLIELQTNYLDVFHKDNKELKHVDPMFDKLKAKKKKQVPPKPKKQAPVKQSNIGTPIAERNQQNQPTVEISNPDANVNALQQRYNKGKSKYNQNSFRSGTSKPFKVPQTKRIYSGQNKNWLTATEAQKLKTAKISQIYTPIKCTVCNKPGHNWYACKFLAAVRPDAIAKLETYHYQLQNRTLPTPTRQTQRFASTPQQNHNNNISNYGNTRGARGSSNYRGNNRGNSRGGNYRGKGQGRGASRGKYRTPSYSNRGRGRYRGRGKRGRGRGRQDNSRAVNLIQNGNNESNPRITNERNVYYSSH